MIGMFGTLRLGLGQEKWMDLHWESNLLQTLELKEALMERYQVYKLRFKNCESLVLRYAPLVRCQVEIDMASLRYPYWERSY